MSAEYVGTGKGDLRALLKRAGWSRDELIEAWNAHLLFGHLKTGKRWPKERLLWELKLRAAAVSEHGEAVRDSRGGARGGRSPLEHDDADPFTSTRLLDPLAKDAAWPLGDVISLITKIHKELVADLHEGRRLRLLFLRDLAGSGAGSHPAPSPRRR